MPLYAGVNETNITPPIGVWMSGYGFRPSGATHIHDELYARALVIDDGTTRLVLISADIIVFAPDMVERLRTQIAEALHTQPHCVMLHATHTHTHVHTRDGTIRTENRNRTIPTHTEP